MAKNPRNPHESSIKAEHSGGWNNEYRNYIQPSDKPKPGLHMPVFGRNRGDGMTTYGGNNVATYDSVYEYQESKSPEVLEDKRLEAAIQRDLKSRNIK